MRRHAKPVAVERELRGQIDTALTAGIDVTHLDHHMGAALAPEFAAITAALAVEYQLPILLPRDLAGYLEVLNMGELEIVDIEAIRPALDDSGLAFGDTFLMGLAYQGEPVRDVYERLVGACQPGVNYLSLHCSEAGEVEFVHPGDHAWRVAEYGLFGDPDFRDWLADQDVEFGRVG